MGVGVGCSTMFLYMYFFFYSCQIIRVIDSNKYHVVDPMEEQAHSCILIMDLKWIIHPLHYWSIVYMSYFNLMLKLLDVFFHLYLIYDCYNDLCI